MRHEDAVVMFLFMVGLGIVALIGNYIMVTFQDQVDEERHENHRARAQKAKEDWKKAHFDRKIAAVQAKKQTKKIDGKKI